ncbi:phosphotransferase system,mannose/fructose/N -acetylgalactosamine-specific component IIB [Actinobacillus ureae]|uniref:PTS system sorbose subfamily IIB component n=1 Tax=Actinobacillus ureae ATCC 25976 TaxID=887324 RepID=E8KDZ4_9PAST|nr:PTS system sorbose subfamily IIB component [Actinobacillus ureae ATCC 25976]SUT87822.1 phosphotransferase system,mannose/fructose/N -acetylgalactosamine-specific component IIB [Actinobacillus ureae]SUU49515.1 phosphotransferase system,mannose/fructose/N -acetylgalactosamine-specific component IIB [Actinobacillus ureae]
MVSNPSDIVRLIEGGVNIKNVNVGGMTFREGDKLISQAVAINQTDLAAFYKLLELGVDMSLQQVAANKKEPLDKARLDAIKF